MRRRVVAVSCALLAGCGGSGVQIEVEAPKDVNQGRPVYMLVRAVDASAFATEPYEAVAAKVTAPDASVLKVEVIYPGAAQEIALEPPEKGDVAVYFFFTRPAAPWKLLFAQPIKDDVAIVLGKDRIKSP